MSSQAVTKKYGMEWEIAVATAKELITEIKIKKLNIAKLALSVCHYQEGGGKASIVKNGLAPSITDFANAIGVKPPTLNGWVVAYVAQCKKDHKFMFRQDYTEKELTEGRKLAEARPRSEKVVRSVNYSIRCKYLLIEADKLYNKLPTPEQLKEVPSGIKNELKYKLARILKLLEEGV